jgi:hypothetical protein
VKVALRALLAFAFLCGCESTTPLRDIRATLLDEDGKPIPGALLYAESVVDGEPFSFVIAQAGHAGEVPEIAIRALKLPWKRGADVALAAFAPGKTPSVRYDPRRPLRTDGVVLTLRTAIGPEDSWNPDLFRLALPFEGSSEASSRMADSLRAPQYDYLRNALRVAYAARPPEALEPGSKEAAKVEAVAALP